MGGGEPTRKKRSEEGKAAGEGSRVERGEEKGTISKRRKTTKRRGATAGRGAVSRRARKKGREGISKQNPPTKGEGTKGRVARMHGA